MECELPKRAEVQGDKGYAGEPNRRLLEKGGYKESLMRKANRNKPLEESDQIRNATNSQTRWIIERAFGLLKNVQGFARSRYRGLVKSGDGISSPRSGSQSEKGDQPALMRDNCALIPPPRRNQG